MADKKEQSKKFNTQEAKSTSNQKRDIEAYLKSIGAEDITEQLTGQVSISTLNVPSPTSPQENKNVLVGEISEEEEREMAALRHRNRAKGQTPTEGGS